MSELPNYMPPSLLQPIAGGYYLLPEVPHGYYSDGEDERGSEKGG